MARNSASGPKGCVALAALFFPLSVFAQTPAPKPCTDPDGGVLEFNRIVEIPAKTSTGYTLHLRAGQGIIIDLADPAGLRAGVVDAAVAAASDAAAADAAATDMAIEAAAATDMFATIEVEFPIRICRSSDKKQLAPGMVDMVFDEYGSDLQYTADGNRLSFLAPADGDYVIDLRAALSYRGADAKRPMEIFVRNRDILRAGDTIKLDQKSRQAGKNTWLATGKFDGNQNGMIYNFTGKAGQQVILSLKGKAGEQFDPYFRLAPPSAKSSIDLIISDIDGSNLQVNNAKLVKTLTESGNYRVQIGGFGLPGEYELTLSMGPTPSAAGKKLAFGKDAQGSIASSDVFEFPVQKGRTYTVKVQNPDDVSMLYNLELLIANPISPASAILGADGPYAAVAFGEVGGVSSNGFTFMASDKRTMFVRAQSYDFSVEGGNYVISVVESR